MKFQTIVSAIANVASVAGFAFAALAWWQALKLRQEATRQQERLQQEIRVILKSPVGTKELALPVSPRRADLSRAELLGRIGMIPLKDKHKARFAIAYTNTSDFLTELQRAQQSEGEDSIVILCSPEEIGQFEE